SGLAETWTAALISCQSRIPGYELENHEGRSIAMSRRYRSVLLVSLLSAVLLGGPFGVAHAQNAGASAVQATKWSDPATWPDRKLPAAGDKVVIAKGQHVTLDISPPALGGLSIEGKLTFSNDADIELTTEWILLHGELEIGTEDKLHTRNATITFTNDVADENIMGMGDRGIMIMGGTLNLHGDRTHTWTKLAATAEKGATQIEVLGSEEHTSEL